MARATSSPSADRPVGEDASHPFRPGVPRSFQTRLTLAFIGVVAVTLALVAPGAEAPLPLSLPAGTTLYHVRAGG